MSDKNTSPPQPSTKEQSKTVQYIRPDGRVWKRKVSTKEQSKTIQCVGPDGKVWRKKLKLNPSPRSVESDCGDRYWFEKWILEDKIMKQFMKRLKYTREETDSGEDVQCKTPDGKIWRESVDLTNEDFTEEENRMMSKELVERDIEKHYSRKLNCRVINA